MSRKINWGHALRGLCVPILLVVLVFALMPPETSTAQDGGTITYTVQPGDNLFRISLRFGVSVQQIAAANGIVNPNIIYVNQVLVIPSPGDVITDPTPPPPSPDDTYVVVRGDTLSSIARRFNKTVSAIAAANGIINVNLIYVGQVLVIPGGSGDPGGNPPPPPPPPSGSFALGGHIANFNHVAEMNQSGMTWAKQQIEWHRGDSVAAAQSFIDQAHANGMSALVAVVGDPNEMGDYNTYTDEFAAYLGQVAALGPEAIEVWNEPNLTREWPAGAISGATYTTMLMKAYNAIKTANSNVMVISAAPAPTGFYGGCTGNGCDDIFFIQQMRDAGAASYMDCIGTHYNEGIISPDQRSGDPRGSHYTRYYYGMLDTYYNTFGGAVPVCFTELGYLTPEGFGSLPQPFAWASNTSLAEHAQWLGRAATLSRSSGRVRLMIVWNVNFSGTAGDDPIGGYAIVRPDGQCPACATLGTAMQ